jgi:hypothetical protein
MYLKLALLGTSGLQLHTRQQQPQHVYCQAGKATHVCTLLRMLVNMCI